METALQYPIFKGLLWAIPYNSKILYPLPVCRPISVIKVSVKVDKRAQIDKLYNYEEQGKIDVHISADTFAEYNNSSEGCKQYSFGQITPSFSVIQP